MTGYAVRYRPAPVSSAASLGLGMVAVGLLVQLDMVWLGLGIIGAGIGFVSAGSWLRHQTNWVAGLVPVLLGVGLVGGAVAMVAGQGYQPSVILVVVPGMVGVVILGFGVFPVIGTGSRLLVKAGAFFVFVAVLVAGVVHVALPVLLVAGALTVVAWDTGENAINIGEHLGNRAGSVWIETTHATGSLFVGGVAVGVGLAVGASGPLDLTLTQFALLIVAASLFMFALLE